MISVCRNLSSVVWTMQCLVLVILSTRKDLTWLVIQHISFHVIQQLLCLDKQRLKLIVEVGLNKHDCAAGWKEC